MVWGYYRFEQKENKVCFYCLWNMHCPMMWTAIDEYGHPSVVFQGGCQYWEVSDEY